MLSIGALSLMILLSFPPQGPSGGRMGDPSIERELGLTDIQMDSIREIRFRTKREIIPLQSQLKLKNLELQHEMQRDNPDERKIMSLADEIASVKAEIRKKNLRRTLRIQKILTPEQRKKFRELHWRRPLRRRPPMMRGRPLGRRR